MNKISAKRTFLSGPYALWAIGFVIIPIVVILRYAFTDRSGGFTVENVLAIFQPVHLKAFVFSLEIALAATVICILLAYLFVMAVVHLHLDRGRLMLFILILPMWMNFILRLLAWQMILSNNGILNLLLTTLGFRPVHIANTATSIMIGVVYDYLPYMVLPIYNVITEIDEDITEAARDLGAGRFTVFWRVIFPLSVPGLLSGITMVFVPSMTSFVTADILGGGKLQLVGNIIEQEFLQSMNWNLGAGISVALMFFVMISMIFSGPKGQNGRESTVW